MPDVYKSSVGLASVYLAPVTQDDLSAYAASAPFYFAPAVTAALEAAVNAKTQYADDQPFDAMNSEGETKITLEVTGIPLDILSQITGRVYDASTGRLFDNAGTPPYFALSFKSKKSNGKYRFYQFLKVRFSMPSDDKASMTDSPDPKVTKITCTAIKTTFQFNMGAFNDGAKRVMGDEDIAGFSGASWFSAVQVPVIGSPAAFTVTPVPADGAVGQAIGVTITLTFSNPLAGGAENAIVLVRSDTQAIIARTRTINAARTIVTMTGANLVSAKTYLIVVPNVVSVYGQVLADVVFDFTTA